MKSKAVIINKHGKRKIIENPSDEFLNKLEWKAAQKRKREARRADFKVAFDTAKRHPITTLTAVLALANSLWDFFERVVSIICKLINDQ